jgi:hypothetical protein
MLEERPDSDEGLDTAQDESKGVISLKPLVFFMESYYQLIPAEPDVIKL